MLSLKKKIVYVNDKFPKFNHCIVVMRIMSLFLGITCVMMSLFTFFFFFSLATP